MRSLKVSQLYVKVKEGRGQRTGVGGVEDRGKASVVFLHCTDGCRCCHSSPAEASPSTCGRESPDVILRRGFRRPPRMVCVWVCVHFLAEEEGGKRMLRDRWDLGQRDGDTC